MTVPIVIGLDVGTSGVRALAVDIRGQVLGRAARRLCSRRSPDGLSHEQQPTEWWRAVCEVTSRLMHISCRRPLIAVAVTSTSGSLVVADCSGVPVRPAILYDDCRAATAAQWLNERVERKDWSASYSLPKALWVREAEPNIWAAVRFLLHPADWLAGKLTGTFGISDASNALKLGYEPDTGRWSSTVAFSGIDPAFLPSVVPVGDQIGKVCALASEESSIPAGTPVIAGATDGIAGLIASGASRVGDANTTLGTTLVWKVISSRKPAPWPSVYCHLHPSGAWAPGAASNTGLGTINSEKGSAAVSEMDRQAVAFLPSNTVCYPLSGRGERFPFVDPAAMTFVEGKPSSAAEWHGAQLQGLAFVERWGYEILEGQCGIEHAEVVFSTGGAATSPVLSQLRANALNRTIARCCEPTAAFGAAILAAAETAFGADIGSAIRTMTRLADDFSPVEPVVARLDELYRSFRDACARRGYGQ